MPRGPKVVVGLGGFEPPISWALGRYIAPKPRGQSTLLDRSLLDLASRQPLETARPGRFRFSSYYELG